MADPYKILGLEKTATEADIRKAYKKLAKKNHPDLNPGDKEAESRFKDISAAYSLLNDVEKRRTFDAGEIDEHGQPKPERHFYREYADKDAGFRYQRAEDLGDLGDLFGTIFRQRGERQDGGAHTVRLRGADVSYTLPVTFLEAVNGGKKRVDMPDGKTLDIAIPAGVRDEQIIRLKGQGMPGIGGGPSGDARITILVEPHPHFRRDGNDIKSVLPVTLSEALNGGSVQVETIAGPVNLKIPKHSNSGRILRLRGKGVQGAAKGDHLVELQVVLPAHADPALETFLADWERDHPYNPRHGGSR